MSVGRRHGRQVGPCVNGHGQLIELRACDHTVIQCCFDLANVDGCDKDVIRDHRQNTVRKEEHRGSNTALHCQYGFDDRREEVLFVNDCHNGKEHDQ